jgi:hypothetical protein
MIMIFLQNASCPSPQDSLKLVISELFRTLQQPFTVRVRDDEQTTVSQKWLKWTMLIIVLREIERNRFAANSI